MNICLRSDSDVTVRNDSGKITYKTLELFQHYIQIWQTAFPRASFFFTKEDEIVCEERLRNNKSDISTEVYPIDRVTDDSFFFVPVPYAASRISIVSGYDLKNISKADVASALHSVYLFQDQVYWLMFTFILLFAILLIAAAIFAHRRELLWLDMMDSIEPMNYQPRRRQSRRSVITQQGYLRRFVLSRVQLFSRNRNSAPKWLRLLFTSLTFYLTTYFCATYSTSSIVEEKPSVLGTYEKLTEHPNASVFFLNYGFRASDSFENAPANSVKGKIWARYLNTRASKDSLSTVSFTKFNECYKMMRDHKYVVIGPSNFAHTIASGFCAFSGSGEIRHIEIEHDLSEQERFFGYAASIRLKYDRLSLRRLRMLAESMLTLHLAQRYSELLYELSGNSDDITKQRAVCTGSLKEETQNFEPVPITYWITFIYSAIFVFCFAFITLLLEHLSMNLTKGRSRKSKVAPVALEKQVGSGGWRRVSVAYDSN